MQFGILGPLLVRDGNTVVEVLAARQRVLLADLLVHAGQAVSAGALVETVWDGAPPAGGAATLRTYVMRLRRALGPDAGSRVVARYPGYLIDAREQEVDLLRFTALCREGGAAVRARAWERASAVLAEALGLWRGAPLADVPSHILHRDEVPRLEQLRLQALEWRIEVGLHLGRHRELVTELQTLAVDHPLRERFQAQLMLALHRCGRQAEALEAYRNARMALVADAGVEPGLDLQQLHQRILHANPDLTAPTLADGDEPAVLTGPATPLVPRQLPAAVPHFAGRMDALETLDRLMEPATRTGGAVISVIGGTAGAGKTALAVRWAHQVAERFPDGQLYVNLRGFGPSDTPMTSAEAIRGFLDALQVPADRIPAETGTRAGLYRSVMAGRRMLVVLDNARDADQVRPLLPGSPGCVVLVTSRSQLAGLIAAEGASVLTLDVLSGAEARALLAGRLGTARIEGEPEAAADLADACARLPLALSIVAARAATRPGFPLSALAVELRRGPNPLDRLDTGDPVTSIRAVFSWSYEDLDAAAARMFRLLGVHPGPDVSASAAASLADVPLDQARRALTELAGAHLVTEHAPDRFAFHDLLHAHAAELAQFCDSDTELRAALHRALDHYLHTSNAATMLLHPDRQPPIAAPAPPQPGTCPEAIADRSHALDWWAAEHRVLLAVIGLAARTGFEKHARQISQALAAILDVCGYSHDVAIARHAALAVAACDVPQQSLSIPDGLDHINADRVRARLKDLASPARTGARHERVS
jgi:DNA-binding SARP family transcriptional activator